MGGDGAARILGDPRREEISPTTCAVCLGERMKHRRMLFVSFLGWTKREVGGL